MMLELLLIILLLYLLVYTITFTVEFVLAGAGIVVAILLALIAPVVCLLRIRNKRLRHAYTGLNDTIVIRPTEGTR